MKLFFRQYGTGSPVIILHGVFGLSDNWVTIGRKLAEKFAVFIPDQRNHGNSPHSSSFNFYAMEEDLLEFIEDQEIENPVIIGHSMGGKVAMSFALNVAIDISKLVIIDISPRAYTPRQSHIQIIKAMQSVDFDKITNRSQVEDFLSDKIPNKHTRLFILKNLDRVNRNRFGWKLNIEAINSNYEHISGGIESSNQFTKPVLFVKGGLSDYITENDESFIREMFPNAIIKTIKRASHWVHAEQPDQLCKILSEFLEKECTY